MFKKVKYIFAIFVIYSVFLIVLFPANIALKYAQEAQVIPKDVSLHGASGSVWSGSLNQVDYQHLELESVRWSLSPLSLLIGQLDVALIVGNRRSDIKANGDVSIDSDGLSVSDFTFSSPIATLIENKPLPYGLNATGKLQGKIDYFTQGKPWCTSLKAKVKTNETVLKSPFGKLDVDKFDAVLSCSKGVLTVVTKKGSNSLGIDGSVLLTKTKTYALEANILPPVNAPQDYINLLKFSGKPNNQGQYSFKDSGRL